MPPRQPPDLAATIARMEGRLAELERTVRRGKAAPKVRDLGDADMSKATDGQVPTYDAATGRYVPSSAGGLVAWFSIYASQIPAGTGKKLSFYLEADYSGGLFSVDPGDNTNLEVARDCVVRFECWHHMASGVIGNIYMALSGVENARRDRTSAPNGEESNLLIAGTDAWLAFLPLRVNVHHDETGSTPSTSAGWLSVTYLRDA